MNTTFWILQGLIAFIFFYSGLNKSIFSEKSLVEKGQTGVEGLPLSLIRFIGISEIFGAIGIFVPLCFNFYPILTPIAAVCLGIIMIPAAIIHYKRDEPKNVFINMVIFAVCVAIAVYRF